MSGSSVTVEGRTLQLSNLEKVLYPRAGFTKAHVIDYYSRIAPVLLPHLKNRPLTLKRYPNGVEGAFFYEKRCPAHRPDWLKTAPVWSDRAEGPIDFCLGNDVPTLVWLANLADLELHTSLALARSIGRPTMMVFDLDPGEPAGLLECAEVGLQLAELFEQLELQTVVKTSGSKGMQVYVPLNTPVTYEVTKRFSRAIAEALEQRFPHQVVSKMKKSLRPGKVLVDWSQNDEHKTTVNVYSLRARENPTVSTPVSWAEVRRAAKAKDPSMLTFEAGAVLERVEALGDLFAPALKLTQRLPQVEPLGAAPRARRARRK